VLDVGGGSGALAAFLRDYAYFLVEPSVNGISGTSLPFQDQAFDVIVACHVLEHIPIKDRERFLDNLLAKARQSVVLLNPFEVPGSRVSERLQLIVRLTGAPWASEHLKCTLPRLEFVENYARSRGLGCSVSPNGTMATSLAMVFCDHFARMAGQDSQLAEVNAFFNELDENLLVSPECPTGYLVTLQRA
jgi:SAM-dependent methyltransferase